MEHNLALPFPLGWDFLDTEQFEKTSRKKEAQIKKFNEAFLRPENLGLSFFCVLCEAVMHYLWMLIVSEIWNVFQVSLMIISYIVLFTDTLFGKQTFSEHTMVVVKNNNVFKRFSDCSSI